MFNSTAVVSLLVSSPVGFIDKVCFGMFARELHFVYPFYRKGI